jgi:uncharacterized protein (DUF736 family)
MGARRELRPINKKKMETNMIIGKFDYDEAADTFTGHIVTLSLEFYGVRLVPTKRSGTKDPAYRVMVPIHETEVEIGAGWKRTSDHGRDFVSVSVDDTSLPAPLNAALFTNDDDSIHLSLDTSQAKKARSGLTRPYTGCPALPVFSCRPLACLPYPLRSVDHSPASDA